MTPAALRRKAHVPWLPVIAVILLTAGLAGPVWAGWDDYKPATLSEITAKHASHLEKPGIPEGAPVINIHPGGDPFRATVVLTGEIRTIGPERNNFIEMWGKAAGVDPKMLAATFEKEIRVQEGGIDYWLPIQNVLIPHLQKEIKKNGRVMLFVVFIGATNEDKVFLVNEFQAQ